MTTLKEFEDALREHGMLMALALLEKLRQRDRSTRSVAPARRVTGRKMTPEVARAILEMHSSTNMTQQEIAFKLGVNQGRVNEVIKRGKWLTDDPNAPEAKARDEAMAREKRRRDSPRPARARKPAREGAAAKPRRGGTGQGQLLLGDF